MSQKRENEILETVTRLLREIVNEEWVREVPVTMETSFSHDLELESIEFVTLAERLREEFGPKIDFAGWLATKELKEILELRVGELVRFIHACEAEQTTE